MEYSLRTRCSLSAPPNTTRKKRPAFRSHKRVTNMAAQLGQFALALAWVVTAYSVVASILGIRFKNDKLIASGRNAAIGTTICITTTIACLGYLFAVSDF